MTPLYSAGLWEAETTAPASSARRATAGVGRTPADLDVGAPRGEAGRERRLEHRAGGAGVAAYEDARSAAPERERLAEPLDELRREVLAHDAADPVSPEVASHGAER